MDQVSLSILVRNFNPALDSYKFVACCESVVLDSLFYRWTLCFKSVVLNITPTHRLSSARNKKIYLSRVSESNLFPISGHLHLVSQARPSHSTAFILYLDKRAEGGSGTLPILHHYITFETSRSIRDVGINMHCAFAIAIYVG